MKLYLAGAISYDVEQAERDFAKAEAELIKAGYKVVNPFQVTRKDEKYEVQIRKTLSAMLLCDAVAYIDNKELNKSQGTQREMKIAKDVRMLVKPLDFYIEKDREKVAKIAKNIIYII